MKKFLSITAVLVCLIALVSCDSDSIEDIQKQQELQENINIPTYARTDTGKDDSVNSEGGGTGNGDDDTED